MTRVFISKKVNMVVTDRTNASMSEETANQGMAMKISLRSNLADAII